MELKRGHTRYVHSTCRTKKQRNIFGVIPTVRIALLGQIFFWPVELRKRETIGQCDHFHECVCFRTTSALNRWLGCANECFSKVIRSHVSGDDG